MLNQIPEFEDYYALFLKDDPAKEPILVGDSSPASLADDNHASNGTDADRHTANSKQQCRHRCILCAFRISSIHLTLLGLSENKYSPIDNKRKAVIKSAATTEGVKISSLLEQVSFIK